MRAVDTNVIVRFLIGDDAEQAAQARAVIGQEPIFVPRTVVLEVEWVLRGVYGLRPEQVVAGLRALAGLPGVEVEDAALVAQAMGWVEAGMDFADALHLAAAQDCEGFVTFDRRLVRVGNDVSGLRVIVPGQER